MHRESQLYVLDGHALLYKAHFAFVTHPLINSKGQDISVSFGVTRMLMHLIKERSPEYLAMAFDRKAPTFRHEIYKEYKMHRPPMPAPIANNIPIVRNIASKLGIRIVDQEGYEADDILGTLVRLFAPHKIHVVLITSDKDLLHLVGDHVSVLAAKKGLSDLQEFNRDKVIEKYCVPPEQMVDYFSMVGDAADNIPGIPGIGPVHAVKLLKEFSSLEGVLSNVDRIQAQGVRKKVQEGKTFALLSRKLIELKCDAAIPDRLEDYQIQSIDHKSLRKLFADLEFQSLLPEISGGSVAEERPECTLLVRHDEILELSRRMRRSDGIALYPQVRAGDRGRRKWIGLAVSTGKSDVYYIPFGYETLEEQADFDRTLSALKPVLEDPSISKTCHDLKNLDQVLKQHDIRIKGCAFDIMIAAYLIDPGRRRFDIDLLAEFFLKSGISKATSPDGSENQEAGDLPSVDAQIAGRFANLIFRLAPVMKEQIPKDGVGRIMDEIEMPLALVLSDMESTGISIDDQLLRSISEDIQKQLDSISKTIYLISGETFNINSTQQLAQILFEKLNFPKKGIKKTKTGYSTSESELQKLVMMGGLFGELPSKILEYRSLFKIKTTYSDTLPQMIDPETGRIHTFFNQTVTETGRLSSSDPNLQNIPVRTELGKKIREAFVASPGNTLLSADYSQMELRILAHVADDQALIDAFQRDQDIHAATAASLFGVTIENVTPEQRRRAKTVNFGIDYGMTPFGLSDRLGISVNEARKYIDQYLTVFKGVRRYIETTKERVIQAGYVETLLGRRRYIRILEGNRMAQESAFRQAINMPIQGSAADIIKIAMIQIHDLINRENLRSRMVLQVHDELLFDVVPEELDHLKNVVKSRMESALELKVPLKVSMNTGPNWALIH